MTKKIIAKNVPQQLYKNYTSCGECHLYGVISSYFAIQEGIGNTEFKTYGCLKGDFGNSGFKIENTDEVHRDCPYIHIESEIDLQSDIDMMLDKEVKE